MLFNSDQEVEQIAKAYALDATDLAKQNFEITLDWSEQSIKEVEAMLDLLHKSSKKDCPSDELILKFSKMFGSYIGEVYRRHHSADWGIVIVNNESVAALQDHKKNNTFWPWGRVNNRIRNGSEDNVWHYYQLLIQ